MYILHARQEGYSYLTDVNLCPNTERKNTFTKLFNYTQMCLGSSLIISTCSGLKKNKVVVSIFAKTTVTVRGYS